MTSKSDILYPRYTNISEILLNAQHGSNRAEKAEDVPKGALQQSLLDSDGHLAGAQISLVPSACPKSMAAPFKASRLSNAEEAEEIRCRLGISGAGPTSGAAAQTAFSFNFAVQNGKADVSHPAGDERSNDAMHRNGSAGRHESAAKEDPALAERLKRVMGETSGRGTERRVFVGGMPFSYEEEDVREYWSYCGDIESLDIMRFPDTGRFKGIAFITFATQEGYEAALQYDGERIDNTQIRVERCKSAGAAPKRLREYDVEERSRDKRHVGSAPKVPGYNVAYIGNIAFEADEGDIRELMGDCTITKVRLHTDKDTGNFKGYAHVHFADEESLDRAMAYDGTNLKGRQLKIGYAQEKKQT